MPKSERFESKFSNIYWTDFLVYFAIREGALKQNIPFDLSVKELFYLIDFNDYHKIVFEASNHAMKKPFDLKHEALKHTFN